MNRARNLFNMQANKSGNEAKPHYILKTPHLKLTLVKFLVTLKFCFNGLHDILHLNEKSWLIKEFLDHSRDSHTLQSGFSLTHCPRKDE